MPDMESKDEKRRMRAKRAVGARCAHGGPVHCTEGCYDEGGNIEKEHRQSEELDAKRGESYGVLPGIHAPSYSSGADRGRSIAGDNMRASKYYRGEERRGYAKAEHERVLGEMKADKTDRRNLADGGEVAAKGLHDSEEKGVHRTYSVGRAYPGGDQGVSMAGHAVRGKHEWGTQEHRRVLNEMKADKGDRRNLADGGDVEPMDADGDRDGDTEGDEMLLEGCAEELMEALQKKDKRAVVEALRALVMNCKG